MCSYTLSEADDASCCTVIGRGTQGQEETTRFTMHAIEPAASILIAAGLPGAKENPS